jgi:putative glutathione S-transferase
LYPAFDSLLPAPLRETIKGPTGLLPTHLCNEIGEINEWVYNTINNGIYKCCFATVQAAYDDNIYPLFESFDRLEAHLADPKYSGPYLFGDHITEADMKLYPTLIRFDVAYYMACKANLNMIRYSYPNLHRWLRTLYWDQSGMARPAFSKTTKFERASQAYGAALLHWLYSSSILNGFSSLGISIAHLQEI